MHKILGSGQSFIIDVILGIHNKYVNVPGLYDDGETNNRKIKVVLVDRNELCATDDLMFNRLNIILTIKDLHKTPTTDYTSENNARSFTNRNYSN